MVKVWLDDERPAPAGWIHVTNVEDCLALLLDHNVGELSLDNDLGTGLREGRHVVDELTRRKEEEGDDCWPPILRIHTANPVARDHMLATALRYGGYTRKAGSLRR